MSEENKNINYPRFIPNKPCGIDKFEGKSQERLTNAIANQIVSTDSNNNAQNLSRIIGLEGGWGVGKSNVIKQLKGHNKIKNNYCLFEYDAWGHQEDLQRRSFLEILTTELIEKNLLSGNTEINIKGGGTKTVTWNEKLKYLLARKTETTTEKYPRISNSMIASFLVAVLTPIFMYIGFLIKTSITAQWLSICLPIIISLLPIIITFFVWCIAKKKDNKYSNLNYLLAIYNDKIENDICYETISENEPTVTEFKNWMQSISEHIGKQNKKLIIVYDNMDRLPAEKVKELWSSIHTFFSEGSFDNVWVIIPFDEKHLTCAFGEDDNDERKKLTQHFISKTFPIVYRVTSPVITDFKEIFNTLFAEAFDNLILEEQKDLINRIFRLEKPNATVREIIEFINQLVVLKNIWQDEIEILFIAIFVLKKENILSNPVAQILSGEYLDKHILNIIPYNENLRKSISALAYGVSLEIAEQIPMTKYLDSCFNIEENTDINRFANSRNFIHILSDKVKNSDVAQLDNIIQCLRNLDVSSFSENNQKTIISLWNTLAQRKMKIPLSKQDIENSHKFLIEKVDFNHKQGIIKYLCEQIQSFKEFNGKDYFGALERLNDWMTRIKIGFKITDYLNDLEKNPDIFVDYVLSAKENYPLYKLTVNSDNLNKYLSTAYIKNSSVLEVLKYLIRDVNYKFDKLKADIEKNIQLEKADIMPEILINDTNFKQRLDAYKILSEEKPLKVQLNPTQRQNIWNILYSKPNTPEFLEIVTIQIANGTNTGGTFDNEQIKYIAENLDYYASYGDLLINNLSWNIPVLGQALKNMTENKLGYTLSLEEILPRFFDVKNNLNVTEQVLFEQLNDWENHKQSITRENIQSIFQNIPHFFQYSVATKNNLTDYLNKTIIEALSTIQTDTLYQQRQQPTYFWNIIIKNLIDTDFLKSLPDNLTELGKKYIDDIAASQLAIPNTNDIVYKLIEKLDRRKTVAHIKDIRDKYCNSQYNINPQLFLYFASWFEKQGDLKHSADRATYKIIEPVINDTNCLNQITANSDYYAEIINAAGDDATTLKDSIRNKIQSSTDANLISFAKKIGVEQEKQEEV